MTYRRSIAVACLAVMFPAMAAAHFQLVYTDETLISTAGDVPVQLIFWHPIDNGPVMSMAMPQAVYAVHRGEKIDLIDSLTPFTFSTGHSQGVAWEAVLPVRRSGDYVLVVEPAPHFDASEGIFIQQFTKSFVSHNQVPTDWSEPVGLPTEILPMNRPSNILAGSTFTGQVVALGVPMAGVTVEIEYISAEPDHASRASGVQTSDAMPGGTLIALTDANGMFTFGIPRAGHWGFAALGSGPVTEHEGQVLSQDAVLWVRAWDMPQ
jgi:cobalt/nickel transport protein